MNQLTTISERIISQRKPIADSGVREILQTSSRMSEILRTNRLTARITLGQNSVLIGDRILTGDAAVEFVFSAPSVFRTLFSRLRLIDFATAYINGDMGVRGSIPMAVEIIDAMNNVTDRPQTVLEFLKVLLFRVSKALIPNIARRFESLDHYSQSAKAYELFLDGHMQYTCGRFEKGNETLGQAQIAKFHFIENLVRTYSVELPGKDHLDIGSGWGGLSAYFEKEFGTRSLGNTNCGQQKKYAEARYGSAIILGDFAELIKTERRFDLITIVGMIEHLTPERRSELLNVVSRLLKKGGLVYLQCIVRPRNWIGGDAYRFVQKEVFPGHFLETEAETEHRLDKHGFTVLEKFEHASDYGRTTALWVDNIQRNEKSLTDMLGARQYRLFLGYTAFASRLFSTQRGSLIRYLVKKV